MTGPRLQRPVGPDDHAAGPGDAPVTLVEYGDFECPYCGQAYSIVHNLRRRLGDRLRFVFRNFPLAELHPHAEHAAEAAEAAGAQGRYWEMHDTLYEHQSRLEDDDLVAYAEQLGLDADLVGEALEDGRFAERVRADFLGGVRSGVNGTPTFFINGARWDGAWSDEEEFLRALETAGGLAKGRVR